MNTVVFLLLCVGISAVGATFFLKDTSANNSYSNICIYSADPAKYKPQCFTCPNVVYPSVLTTCVNGTSMPKNISFAQAECVNKNCAINYPTPEPQKFPWSLDESMEKKVMSILGLLQRVSRSVNPSPPIENLISEGDENAKSILNRLRTMDLPDSDINITQYIEAFASEYKEEEEEKDEEQEVEVEYLYDEY